jgi:hypothetical protein
VKIKSLFASPIQVRIFVMAPDDDFGTRVARCVGHPVTLKPGVNEIDAEFWRDWLGQNGGGLLAAHLVAEEEEALAPPLPAEELDGPPLS